MFPFLATNSGAIMLVAQAKNFQEVWMVGELEIHWRWNYNRTVFRKSHPRSFFFINVPRNITVSVGFVCGYFLWVGWGAGFIMLFIAMFILRLYLFF